MAQQARLFGQTASATPDLVYVFGLDSRFPYANRRLLEVWGRTFEDAVGRSLDELGYPARHAEMHLSKPVEPAELVATVASLARRVPR